MAGIHALGQQTGLAQTQYDTQTNGKNRSTGRTEQPSLLKGKAAVDQATFQGLPLADMGGEDAPFRTTAANGGAEMMSRAGRMTGKEQAGKENNNDDQVAGGKGQAGGKGKAGGKGGCKGKGGGFIPPGLAKKQAADLPAGNPWKAVLEQREAEEAKAAEEAQAAEKAPTADPAYEAAPVAGDITPPENQAKSLLAQLIDELLMGNEQQTEKPNNKLELLKLLLTELLAGPEAAPTAEEEAAAEAAKLAEQKAADEKAAAEAAKLAEQKAADEKAAAEAAKLAEQKAADEKAATEAKQQAA